MPRGKGSRAFAFAAGVAVFVCSLLVGLTPARADVAVIMVSGRGWGHGVGLAQDGALQMGRQGFGLGQILGQFYPGTSFGHGSGPVRVPVLGVGQAPAETQVTFPDGGQVVDGLRSPHGPGFPMPVAAGATVTFTWDGTRYAVGGGSAGTASAFTPAAGLTATTLLPPHPVTTPTTVARPTTTAPRRTTTTTGAPSTTTAPPPPPPSSGPGPSSTQPLWAIPNGGGAIGVPGRGRSYRGMIEADGTTGVLRLVNQVDVETYLVGMGEVRNPSWPLPSLEAQEVAARTYALRAMAASGELCDDTRCQVYLGVDGEYPLAAQAVRATAGEVLLSGGGLADAVYSANAAGYSASRQEGFGTADDASYPYLRPAPYPTGDALPWSTSVATADVARLFGLSGPLTDVKVLQKGPSGRALGVALTAGATTKTVTGLDFAATLGLRSTLIDSIGAADAAVAPPAPAGSSLQVDPDQAGAAAAVAPSPLGITPPVLAAPPPAGLAAGAVPVASSHHSVPFVLALLAFGLVGLTGWGAVRTSRARPRG